jgi:hypothetical protein
MSLDIGLLLLAACAGVLVWKRLAARGIRLSLDGVVKQSPLLSVGVPLMFCGVVAFAVATSSSSLAWHLPLWLAYYDTALMWGTLLALSTFVLSLTVVVAFQTRHQKRWGVVSAGVLVLVALHSVQWYYTQPVAPYLTHAGTADGVILQSSGESCAAAAGANIARGFGLQKTEKEMAELFGTTRFFGTSAAQVVYGMRALGLATHKVEIPEADPAQLSSLAMLFVDHPVTGPESHAVAFIGFAHGQAEIWDPLEGKRFLDKSQLAQIWHGRGLIFVRQAAS